MEHLVVRDELLRLRSDLAAIAARIDELVLAFDFDESNEPATTSILSDIDVISGFGHLDACADVISFDDLVATGDAGAASVTSEAATVDTDAAVLELIEPAEGEPTENEAATIIEWQHVAAMVGDWEPEVVDAVNSPVAASETDAHASVLSVDEEPAAVTLGNVMADAEADHVIELDTGSAVTAVMDAELEAIADEPAVVADEASDTVVVAMEATLVAEIAPACVIAADDDGLSETVVAVADDLSLIAGIDVTAKTVLSEAGIDSFDQIVSLTPDVVAGINERLGAKGRVSREGWIEQAAVLAAGGSTKFSEAVKDGTVASLVAPEVSGGSLTAEAMVEPVIVSEEIAPAAVEAAPAVTALVLVKTPATDNVIALVPATERLRANATKSAALARRRGGWMRSIAAALAVAAVGVGAYGASNEDFSRSARERLCQVDVLRDTQACGLVRASMVMFNR